MTNHTYYPRRVTVLAWQHTDQPIEPPPSFIREAVKKELIRAINEKEFEIKHPYTNDWEPLSLGDWIVYDQHEDLYRRYTNRTFRNVYAEAQAPSA